MAQTKHQIEALLAAAGIEPRRRFGQNFMIDQNLVRIVAEEGMIGTGDLVIEVGPGTGTLSEELLARPARVCLVEIDRDLAKLLRSLFETSSNFELIEGDALAGKHSINSELAAKILGAKNTGKSVRLVANLPYNIASPLVVNLLVAGVDSLTFTVQKEVADRLASSFGTHEYGPLSIVTQMLADVEILRVLSRDVFWPKPKIESALVRLIRRDRLGEKAREFSKFIQGLFSARRKTIRNSLRRLTPRAEELLNAVGIASGARPEEISPEKLWELFAKVGSSSGEAN